MAHSPSSRPNSSDANEMRSVSSAELELGAWLTEWQNALAAHGAGPLSADLALDLVLNKIVELALESTHATAAAIALTREGEIICRAAAGESAPDLGTRLSSHTGLSAACVQTGNWQYCEDSESDARVDAELCRRLGVRSMLVVPVVKEGKLLGVLEVFSAQPQGFGDRELQTLRMLSRGIVENVELAAKLPANTAGTQAREEVMPREENVVAAAERGVLAEGQSAEAQTADFWTGVLMIAVVALALTLGWMVGRAGWHRQWARGNGADGQVQRAQNQVAQNPVPVAAAVALPGAPSGVASGGDLVMYQNGKLVFPQPPQPAKPRAESVASGTGVQPAAGKGEIAVARPVRIPAEVAAELVAQRVEPEYPQAARERRVQGAVDLDALVGKDGVVEKFTAIRGDPDLAAAASAAVRQWRFKPYLRDGQPEGFQTRITVTFRLP
ncbi:MAG: TonB family protein [Terriglobales bacterium]|jgi:TonB family protein